MQYLSTFYRISMLSMQCLEVGLHQRKKFWNFQEKYAHHQLMIIIINNNNSFSYLYLYACMNTQKWEINIVQSISYRHTSGLSCLTQYEDQDMQRWILSLPIYISCCVIYLDSCRKWALSNHLLDKVHFYISLICSRIAIIKFQQRYNYYDWGSRNGTVVRLLCPMFYSLSQRHMWVELVVGSHLCSECFSPGSLPFPIWSGPIDFPL